MQLVFLPSTRSDLLWMRTYYDYIFPDGAKRAAEQYRRTGTLIRNNPLVGRAVEEMEGCENTRSRARCSPSSTGSLASESKSCVSGMNAVSVRGFPDASGRQRIFRLQMDSCGGSSRRV